jgi:tetratricopeptide (TPR) repeat protein
MSAPLISTKHPLQRMTEQLRSALIQRDSRVLNRWLCGEGLPRLTREGDLPHEVLWELIHQWWQPDPRQLQAFMEWVCDALDACLLSVKAQSTSRADGTTGQPVNPFLEGGFGQPAVGDAVWPVYCRSLFGLCALLPQHEGVFDRLDALDSVAAMGSVALQQHGVLQALQRSLIEQQTDDRLLTRRWQADFDLAINQMGANHWREPAAQLLASWRAMVIACASDSIHSQVSRPELHAALARTADMVGQWPQHEVAVEMLLAQMLAHWPRIQGGPALAWKTAVQQSALPLGVKTVAQDLWPEPEGVDSWVATASELAAPWRKLGRAGRDAVRQCASDGRSSTLNDLQFQWVRAGMPKNWVNGMVKLLRQHVPGLQASSPTSADYQRLQAEDQRSAHAPHAGVAKPTQPASNHERFVATQKSLTDVSRLLARRQAVDAERRAHELLTRQASYGTSTALQSKTAANLATAFAEVGRFVFAKALWERAMTLNPGDPVARNGLAEVLKEQGELAGARTQYENTLQSHPQDVVARNGLAEVLKEQGDLAGARTQYENTLQSHPQSVVARCGLANVLKEQGDLAGARAQYENTLQSHPQDVVARCGLANVLKEQGDLAGARAQYENTLQSHPQDVVARNGLAEVLKEQGDLAGARTQYENTLQSHPQSVVARCGLANVLKEQGDLAGARAQYENTLQSHPQSVVARNGLANVLKEQGDLAGARTQYENTLQSHPQDVVARNGLAEVLKEQGDLAGARTQYENTLQSHPQSVVARCGLANVLKEQGDLAGARAQYENTLQSHPQSVVARCGLAEVLKEQGDLAGARAQYENTLQSHPQSVVARCGLANVLKEQGDLAGARTQYENTLQSHPQDVVARNGLANVLRRLGLVPDARNLLKDWAQSVGRQRLLDGVVYALACVPDRGEEALKVLERLQTESVLRLSDRIRLNALRVSVKLKLHQPSQPGLRLAEVSADVPAGLRAWLEVVQCHHGLRNGQSLSPVGADQIERLGWARDKVKQLLERLAQGDGAANDELFELEAEALMAA